MRIMPAVMAVGAIQTVSWTTEETSEAGNDVQPETGGEDFFSSGQYETEASGAVL